MTRRRKNMAASIRQRLLNRARERREEFSLVLLRYTLERFLYRLGRSEYRNDFLLKGAMLYTLWAEELESDALHRPTRDLDLLAFGSPELAKMENRLRSLCALEVDPEDGLVFLEDAVQLTPIRPEDRYAGIRARFCATLDQARIPIQIDIGFGDSVVPEAQPVSFPTLLDQEPPQIRAYHRATVVAEKLHAMVERGLANSRMKDFFDLSFLARHFTFEGETLRRSIRATFARRRTQLPDAEPVALTPAFLAAPDKQIQWKAFLRKSRLPGPPLEELASELRGFLLPVIHDVEEPFDQRWPPGGPWSPA